MTGGEDQRRWRNDDWFAVFSERILYENHHRHGEAGRWNLGSVQIEKVGADEENSFEELQRGYRTDGVTDEGAQQRQRELRR